MYGTRPTRSTLAALTVAAALLGTAASAQADSIVYIDGGNVWSSTPDGARKVQLTDGGDWHSPTQSDNGLIAAVEGASNLITVMAADGRPLHTIQTASAPSGDGATFAARPLQLAFSPDGQKIAYSYIQNSCATGSTCGTIQRATFYTYASVTTATPSSLFGQQMSVSDPAWIGNDRVVLSGGYGTALSYDDLSGGGDSSFTRWVRYPDKDMGGAEVSPDGQKLVATWDYGANTKLSFSVIGGNARVQPIVPDPTPACETSTPDAQFADPSWSPDSMAVAFHDTDGIEVLRFKAIAANACQSTGPSKILASSGSEPDWGPADPPAARYSDASPAPAPGATQSNRGTSTPGGGSSANGQPQPAGSGATTPNSHGSAGAGTLQVSTTSLKLAALRKGTATIKVTIGRAGQVNVRLTSGTTAIASGRATAKAAGTVTVHLSRAGRRAVASLSGRSSALVRVTESTKGAERLEGSRTVKIH